MTLKIDYIGCIFPVPGWKGCTIVMSMVDQPLYCSVCLWSSDIK